MPRPTWKTLLVVLALAAVAAACANDPFDPGQWENLRPTAQIWVEPARPDSLQPTSYNQATFHWSGTDEDGFIEGFHVAIGEGDAPPATWIYTTIDETTATYVTDAEGRARPTLYVAAQDDRGAVSDTARVTFPLINFPPVLEFQQDYLPPTQSFGAATFLFLGFDLDGDETLLPWIEYRYAGSDSTLVFELDDPLADPAQGWVRLDKDPTRFSLTLRDIPAGDPQKDFEQSLYIRILDEAGGTATFRHDWKVFEVVGQVLLVDDALNSTALASRDSFYYQAMDALLPDAHSVWDISGGLPQRDEDVWLTLSQFRFLVWYTGNSESQNLLRVQNMLTTFLSTDLDPDEPGVQSGQLLLESQYVVGASSLSSSFRTNVLGLAANPDPRTPMRVTSTDLGRLGGMLDIVPQAPGVPALGSVGRNYLGGSGFYFGIYGLVPLASAAPLYAFEEYDYTGDRRPESPVVAVRRPVDGEAKVVTVGFQLEYADGLGNAVQALGSLLQDQMGLTVQPVGAKR